MPNLISRLYNFVDDANNGVPITALRVDSELNQLVNTQNQAAIVSASAPSSPINGEIWVDSTNKFVKQYRNSEWVIMGVVQYGAVMSTPQAGDIWIDSSGSEIVFNVRNKANSAWIQLSQGLAPTTATGLLPSGAIIKWKGTIATIPSGFYLCDGSNETPDMRDKFVVGASSDDSGVAKTNLTGSLTQTGGNVNHTHDMTHTHDVGGNTDTGSGHISENDKKFTTSGPSTSNTGNNSTVAVPYYALAYIMKS